MFFIFANLLVCVLRLGWTDARGVVSGCVRLRARLVCAGLFTLTYNVLFVNSLTRAETG